MVAVPPLSVDADKVEPASIAVARGLVKVGVPFATVTEVDADPPIVVATTEPAETGALVGTVITGAVALAVVTVAATPPTVKVAPVRLVPLTVMLWPRTGVVELNEVIVGAALIVKAPAEVTVPAALVTTTSLAPTDKPEGTTTEIEVAPAAGAGDTVAEAPPMVTVGCEVRAGIALLGTKFAPATVRVSPALPEVPEPTVAFSTEVIVGAEEP